MLPLENYLNLIMHAKTKGSDRRVAAWVVVGFGSACGTVGWAIQISTVCARKSKTQVDKL